MAVQDEQEAVFHAFKAFFEDEDIKKVWHNYSFDRHVLANHVSRSNPWLCQPMVSWHPLTFLAFPLCILAVRSFHLHAACV